MDQDDDNLAGVRVVCRLRPLNPKEVANGQTVGWQYNNTTMLETLGTGTKSYRFDKVLGPSATNDQAYDEIAKQLVSKSLNGYNTTVFAYGQTGSGKTWTMMGDDHGRHPGIIPKALEDMFAAISKDEDRDYLIRCSFMELYNETINDLLNTDGTGSNLTIVADDPAKGAIIGGLLEQVISSVAGGMELIELGNRTRQVASTAMNARSSRSHTVFRVVLEATKTEAALERERKLLAEHVDEPGDDKEDATVFKSFGKAKKEKSNTVVSYLNLVDLAGSERQTHSKSEGKQLKEGAAINKSLLALGAVIAKLSGGLDDSDDHHNKDHRKKRRNSMSGGGSGGCGGSGGSAAGIKSHDMRRLQSMRSVSSNEHSSRSYGKKQRGEEHIPYRNSKLTRILRQSLGGNTFTAIVIAMTPAPMYREESRSTLKFGQMCKKIKNKAKKNNVADDKTLLKQYKLQIAKLKEQMATAAPAATEAAESKRSNSTAEANKEADALRSKLKILQTMFLGGDSNEVTKDLDLVAKDIEAVKTSSNMWAKMRLGFHKSKLKNQIDGAKHRHRSNSTTFTQEGMGDFRMLLSGGGGGGEGDSEDSTSLSTLDSTYHRARYKRMEKELAKFKDQKETTASAVVGLNEELAQERQQSWEKDTKLTEALEKIQTLDLAQNRVMELVAQTEKMEKEIEQEKVEEELKEKNRDKELRENNQKMEDVQSHLVLEEKRSTELELEIARLEKKVSDLETHVKAGRNAMQTMQAKILGKNGQRLAIMAVDLENTVAEFQAKQEKQEQEDIELSRRETSMSEREMALESRLELAEQKETSTTARLQKAEEKEKQAANWKSYAEMQEAAFNRRDAEIDRIGQEQESRAQEVEDREEAVHKRETWVHQEEDNCAVTREELAQMSNQIRTQQHELETRAMTIGAATRIQGMVRQMLRSRAAKAVLESDQRQKLLDEREKRCATQEARQREEKRELHGLRVKAELHESTNERLLHVLNNREAAVARRQEDLTEAEKRQRELQEEVEKRHVDVIARETAVGDLRGSMQGREWELEAREEAIETTTTTLKARERSIYEKEQELQEKLNRMHVGQSALAGQAQKQEERLDNITIREKEIERQETVVHSETERVRVEWEKVRVATSSNAHQSKELLDAKNECMEMENGLREREKEMNKREKSTASREQEVLELEPREQKVQAREKQQEEREHEFYENTAAKVHSKQAEQIRTLEQWLEKEIRANKNLQTSVTTLRDQLAKEIVIDDVDEKQEGESGDEWLSLRLRSTERLLSAKGVGASEGEDEEESNHGGGNGGKVGSGGGNGNGNGDGDNDDDGEKGIWRESKVVRESRDAQSPNGVRRLHRARSMIRHMIEGGADTQVPARLRTNQQQLVLPSPPPHSRLRAEKKTNTLNLRAEKKFRKAIDVIEREAQSHAREACSWNTWFRIVGGREEHGLSLQVFRHLIRRCTKISNGAMSDQELRCVFEMIDVERKGYISLQLFLHWMNGENSRTTTTSSRVIEVDVLL